MAKRIQYKRVFRNGRKVLLHRAVVSEHLGRPLTKNEVVHHVNGDIRDNRLENLLLLTEEEHVELHRRESHELSLLTVS
jgi:hypothetical protein